MLHKSNLLKEYHLRLSKSVWSSPLSAAPSRVCCRSCCSSRWLPEGCYRKRRDKIAFENPILFPILAVCDSSPKT
jgi:hypothetical protein